MLRVAVRAPAAPGVKVTVKVVVAKLATGEPGCTVTTKSPGLAPATTTFGTPVRLRLFEPRFLMVNVRLKGMPTPTLAKSVWSVRLGVLSPSTIEVLLPRTSISGGVMANSWMSSMFQISALELLSASIDKAIEVLPLGTVTIRVE